MAVSVTKFGWLVNVRSMHELNDWEIWAGSFVICDRRNWDATLPDFRPS